MKKTLLSLCLLALLSGSAWAQDVTQAITINGEPVEKTAVQLAFSGDNVTLTYSDQSTQTADMGVVSITFSTSTGIGSLTAFEYKGLVDGWMSLGGLAAGTQVAIYDAAGHQLFAGKATGTEMQVDAASLQSGVYVLRVGNQAVKFLKQ